MKLNKERIKADAQSFSPEVMAAACRRYPAHNRR